MVPLLPDTHVWARTIHASHRVSSRAADAIARTDPVWACPASFHGMGLKERKGRCATIGPYLPRPDGILAVQSGLTTPSTPEMCLHVGARRWDHDDPFDRMVASTAEPLDLTLVTEDGRLTALLPDRTLW